jgi:hypothetical protein
MAISFSNNIKIQPITYQEFINSEYIPEYGEIIIISDYKQVNGVNVPSFALGDGSTMLKNLKISGDYIQNANHSNTSGTADIAKKLEHSITIGNHVFNGTSYVSIPIYDGSNEIE